MNICFFRSNVRTPEQQALAAFIIRSHPLCIFSLLIIYRRDRMSRRNVPTSNKQVSRSRICLTYSCCTIVISTVAMQNNFANTCRAEKMENIVRTNLLLIFGWFVSFFRFTEPADYCKFLHHDSSERPYNKSI